jgi:hypothetical protein
MSGVYRFCREEASSLRAVHGHSPLFIDSKTDRGTRLALSSLHQSMRRISIALFFALTLFLFSPGGAQTPDASKEERLQTLIKEVQTRQAQIADNQTKIDSKLADIAETMRQARLFAGRSK